MSPEQLAAHDRRRNIARYGITVEAYEAMFRAQNGACAICRGNELSGRRLAVDHCHTTGTVRGLLCAGCNRGIGYMGDSVQNLNAAAEYLTRADEKSRRGNIEVNGKGDI